MAKEGNQVLPIHPVIDTRAQLREDLRSKGWWISVPLTTFDTHWLYEGEQRLDAGYYASEAFAARQTLEDSNLETLYLQRFAHRLFYPNRFKRIYVKSRDKGVPFLKPTETLHFRPYSTNYLARTVSDLDSCRVQPGQILITRSGTVGRCTIVTERLREFAVSDDMIRLEVKDLPTGYVYAFLTSWIGQALIAKDQYGSAIKHLEPHHLSSVPVPILPKGFQESLDADIIRSYEMREEAIALLQSAEEQLQAELELKPFDEKLVDYMPPPSARDSDIPAPKIKAFTTTFSELNERLDASYHVPLIQSIFQILRGGKYPLKPLSALTNDIVIPPRFKRIYVDEAHGTPFLQPSHLPLLRPYDHGFLAETTPHLDELLLNQGEILVTTDGTVGRVAIVTDYLDGWAGSNNMARIRYGIQNNQNGYLALFFSLPYGHYQLVREIYGGVVDHLESSHINQVMIPDAPIQLQIEIGEQVVRAYELKDSAIRLEDNVIHRLEAAIEERARQSM